MGKINKWGEFLSIIAAWLHGEGDLPGLLHAWWQVATGRVTASDRVRATDV